jgi:hypothetical protein
MLSVSALESIPCKYLVAKYYSTAGSTLLTAALISVTGEVSLMSLVTKDSHIRRTRLNRWFKVGHRRPVYVSI